MKKIVLVPDSFKGTLSAIEVAEIMENAIKKIDSTYEVKKIPIADGGEGTLDCFLNYFGYKKVEVNITNHLKNKIKSYYGYKEDCAIIEIASACGITLEEGLYPYKATTYGVGELIKHAILSMHVKNIILTLGGSATNDLGLGMLKALGAKFYEKDKEIEPSVLNINKITNLDLQKVKNLIKGINITCLTDVKNTLCGPLGATAIFGPQKGIKSVDIEYIDNSFKKFANLVKNIYGVDYINALGSGAAGGMGYAAISMLDAKLMPGIDTILDMVNFNKEIENAELVITGEGKFDLQSLNGKAISGIANRCKKRNKKLLVLCGALGNINDTIYNLGITKVESINPINTSFQEAKKNVRLNLYNKTIETIKSILKEEVK